MPPRLYDDTDSDWHPVLVVRVDRMFRLVRVATRTTKPWARTTVSVSHPAAPALRLNMPGWWRLGDLHPVPFASFADPEVDYRGALPDDQWSAVLNALDAAAR